MMKAILSKLLQVQTKLKAPKSQRNDFGKYNYRNCEDILEALKPILDETKTTLILQDEVKEVGGRFYVEATITFYDIESGEHLTAKASAREEEVKKGMDGSQITGASSSYARKYALNGLFAIDDTKDSDTTNTGADDGKNDKSKPATDDKKAVGDGKKTTPQPCTAEQTIEIGRLYSQDDVKKILIYYKVENLSQLSFADAAIVIARKKKPKPATDDKKAVGDGK